MLLVKDLGRLYTYLDAILFHLMQCNIPLFLARRFPHKKKT